MAAIQTQRVTYFESLNTGSNPVLTAKRHLYPIFAHTLNPYKMIKEYVDVETVIKFDGQEFRVSPCEVSGGIIIEAKKCEHGLSSVYLDVHSMEYLIATMRKMMEHAVCLADKYNPQ